MGEFTITVKPDLIRERVEKAVIRDIDKICNQYSLDKGEIMGDGLDIQEAKGVSFDMFQKISGGDTKITKADLIKFAGTEMEQDIINEYAQKIRESLPAKVIDTTAASVGAISTLSFKIKSGVGTIRIAAERGTAGNVNADKLGEPAAAAAFSIINGVDKDNDGKLFIGSELKSSEFVQTTDDALKIAGDDAMIVPEEALKAVLDKANKFRTSDVTIEYAK